MPNPFVSLTRFLRRGIDAIHRRLAAWIARIRPRDRGDAIRLAIRAVALLVFIGSLAWIGYRQLRYSAEREAYERIEESLPTSVPSDPGEAFNDVTPLPTPVNEIDRLPYDILKGTTKLTADGILPEYVELHRQNPDFVGWIRMPGYEGKRPLSYPIMYSGDNDFYIYRDFFKQQSYAGSIFMEGANDPTRVDKNMVLYGHAMKDKTMFGHIEDYPNVPEEYLNNRKIYVDLLFTRLEYEVFAAYEVRREFNYRQTWFRNDREFLDFVNNLLLKNTIDFGVTITEKDRILTLSTCKNDTGSRWRVPLHARLVRQILYDRSETSSDDISPVPSSAVVPTYMPINMPSPTPKLTPSVSPEASPTGEEPSGTPAPSGEPSPYPNAWSRIPEDAVTRWYPANGTGPFRAEAGATVTVEGQAIRVKAGKNGEAGLLALFPEGSRPDLDALKQLRFRIRAPSDTTLSLLANGRPVRTILLAGGPDVLEYRLDLSSGDGAADWAGPLESLALRLPPDGEALVEAILLEPAGAWSLDISGYDTEAVLSLGSLRVTPPDPSAEWPVDGVEVVLRAGPLRRHLASDRTLSIDTGFGSVTLPLAALSTPLADLPDDVPVSLLLQRTALAGSPGLAPVGDGLSVAIRIGQTGRSPDFAEPDRLLSIRLAASPDLAEGDLSRLGLYRLDTGTPEALAATRTERTLEIGVMTGESNTGTFGLYLSDIVVSPTSLTATPVPSAPPEPVSPSTEPSATSPPVPPSPEPGP